MKALKLITIIVIVNALNGCVMVKNEDWVKLSQDITDLKKDAVDSKKAKEAFRLQAEDARVAVEALKAQIQDIQKGTAAQLSTKIAAAENALSALEKDLRKRQADTVADMTAVRSDFQVLTGRFEETRYAILKSVQEGKSSKEEVDIRLKGINQGLEDLQKRIASLEQSVTLLRQEREQGKEQGKEKVTDAPNFEDAYKNAYETFQKGDYRGAIEMFAKYLEEYPASKYAENAQYWIGESYYGEKNYERAIVEFDNVVRKYPEGAKAPYALIQQGSAFSMLGDKKSANTIYKKVIEKYPKSEQASLARKRLKE